MWTKPIFVNCFCVSLIAISLGSVNGAKILGFFVSPSPSHFVIDAALMRGLLAKGHNLTVITTHVPIKISEPTQNYREIYLDIQEDDVIHKLVDAAVKNKQSEAKVIWRLPQTLISISRRSSDLLKHKKLQEFLQNKDEKFDLVIIGWFVNDFHLGIAGHYRCPSVVLSPQPHLKPLRDLVGNPASVSTVPVMTMGHLSESLTFWQRLKLFVLYTLEYIGTWWLNVYLHEPYYNENFPASKNYPTFDEVKRNVSLVLVNHHFSLGGIRPLMPNLIEISGIQAKLKPDPLPTNIQSFLDGAGKHGAILFSLGSNVKSSNIELDKLNAIVKVFGQLKQRILWRWDDSTLLQYKPENVFISKWLPQDDILAHPNIRLFISHCGLGSVNEAKFHGVPILAMPLFGDQPTNAKAVVEEGWAYLLSYNNLTEESFAASIYEMINNRKYENIIKRLSLLYRDRPQTALDTAVYWIEYVLRHNGAKHLQSDAVHLNFFQLYSLDVIACILCAIFITLNVMLCVLKTVYRMCDFSRKRKQKSN